MNKKNSKLAKILITNESFLNLKEMNLNLNKDYHDGKITHSKLNSWVINWFYKLHFNKQFSKIREDHCDPIKQLEALVKIYKKEKSMNSIEHSTLQKELKNLKTKINSKVKSSTNNLPVVDSTTDQI